MSSISYKPHLCGKVSARLKTETRRIKLTYIIWKKLHKLGWWVTKSDWERQSFSKEDIERANALLEAHEVIVSYKPGMYQKSVGKHRILRLVRECLQDITPADIRAEGLEGWGHKLIENWITLWDEINDKRGFRWADNPELFVIKFEVTEVY